VVSKPHYLVVIGYDSEGFTAHDGYTPQNRYSYDRFGAIWGKMGNAYLLVYRDEGQGSRDEAGKRK
jgi:hypothetical protein